MRRCLFIITLLFAALSMGNEFIEPNPNFLRSFWKTLPVEEELPSEPSPHSRGQSGEATLAEESVPPSYTAPRPPLLFWGAVVLAAVTGFLAAAEILALSRELLFRLRLKSALGSGDYRKVLVLLQHHLHQPPGTSLSQLADSLADARLADQLRALEVELFASSYSEGEAASRA